MIVEGAIEFNNLMIIYMRKFLFYLSLTVFNILAVTSISLCSEWINLGQNKFGMFLYDKTSITRPDNGMIKVDWKTIFSTDAAKAAADILPKMKGVSFVIYNDMINCLERTYKSERMRYYNKKGNLLSDSINNDPKYGIGFRPIPPETAIQRLAEIICK